MKYFYRLLLYFLERPKVMISIGIILLVLGTIFAINLPSLGEPIRKFDAGNKIYRYWATEEEKERAETRKTNRQICFALLLGGFFLIVLGISGLKKEPPHNGQN
jgi:hypothetical protein